MILVHVTTVPETFNFFRGQIGYLKKRGFIVHAVSSSGKLLEETALREGIPVHAIEMPRRISPLVDLKALYKLYRLFSIIKPSIVHAHTPKGGLLGVLAARLAGVPAIVYTMHGLPFKTATGWKRRILCWSETLACKLSDRVIAVSAGNRQEAINMGFCPGNKIQILASGSCNGVDAANRFNPQMVPPGTREALRNSYNIDKEALVIGYVGRIVRDKGMLELEEAWKLLKEKFPELFLLLVGHEEAQDPVPPEVMARLKASPNVIITGWVGDPVPFYAVMDILVLPTYREGFPIAPLEAAAMAVPVVATRVDGCGEAVEDGVTGILVPPQDSSALTAAIQGLLLNQDLRKQMGSHGRQRVLKYFKPEIIWEHLHREYICLTC